MIHGPTASGKTSLAIELAQDSRNRDCQLRCPAIVPGNVHWGGTPVQGGARHCYTTMALQAIASIEALTAGSYAAWGRPLVKALLDKHGSAVVVGGSGLYAKKPTLCHG